MEITSVVLGVLVVLIDITDKKEVNNIYALLKSVFKYILSSALIFVPIIMKLRG